MAFSPKYRFVFVCNQLNPPSSLFSVSTKTPKTSRWSLRRDEKLSVEIASSRSENSSKYSFPGTQSCQNNIGGAKIFRLILNNPQIISCVVHQQNQQAGKQCARISRFVLLLSVHPICRNQLGKRNTPDSDQMFLYKYVLCFLHNQFNMEQYWVRCRPNLPRTDMPINDVHNNR